MDRGGTPAEFGPFYGIVKNTTDSIRAGRVQVYISAFADPNLDEDDETKWITVNYLPSFFGSTPYDPPKEGVGTTIDGNANSYGMWFTPPDIGVTVLCVFANGDRSQGYYIGVVPDQSVGYMVPAIAGTKDWVAENGSQAKYCQGAEKVPVVEINTNNIAFEENRRFWDKPKPVHGVVAATMFTQGLIKETKGRGPITSSAQRESPSAVFGVSTPGAPIYQGGQKRKQIQKKLENAEIKPQDIEVIGRLGGHSIVMDDGDIEGENELVRIRTTAGHQITMSDSGEFFYIIHANGLTWIELGKEGTVDVYATNSVNVRTRGDINFHADRDINMCAGRNINMKAAKDKPYTADGGNINIEAKKNIGISAQEDFKLYSKSYIGVKSDGTIALDSEVQGSWLGGTSLLFTAGSIQLNGPPAAPVEPVDPLTTVKSDDSRFSTGSGWYVIKNKLESIVSRAPTHEPFGDKYSYHNKGVDVDLSLEDGQPTPPPDVPPIPPGVEIKKSNKKKKKQ